MDRLILEEKLESLRRCVLRLQDKRALTATELQADLDRQDIIALNLTRAVQLCVDMASHILSTTERPVPTTMGEAFAGLETVGLIDAELCRCMQAAAGFRNIAVHSYQQINWDIVHSITWQHLDDFRSFARAVSDRIDDDEGQ